MSNFVQSIAPLTESEIQEFVANWYQKLDVHAPLEDFAPLLAGEELEIQVPEGSKRGFAGFKSWYKRAISLFFDEVHIVRDVKLTPISDNLSKVKVVVHWEASIWKPPAPQSERINLEAYQTWIMKRSLDTQKPVIVNYLVDSIDYAEGSAKL